MTYKSASQKENRCPKPCQAREPHQDHGRHTQRSSSLASSSLQDTWKLLDLGSSPSGLTSQGGSTPGSDSVCSWAAAVTVVAVRTRVGAVARLPGALLGLVKLPHFVPPCPSCGVVSEDPTFCVHTQGQSVSPSRHPADDSDIPTQSGAHRDGRIRSTGSQGTHLKGPFGDTVCDQDVARRTEGGHR